MPRRGFEIVFARTHTEASQSCCRDKSKFWPDILWDISDGGCLAMAPAWRKYTHMGRWHFYNHGFDWFIRRWFADALKQNMV